MEQGPVSLSLQLKYPTDKNCGVVDRGYRPCTYSSSISIASYLNFHNETAMKMVRIVCRGEHGDIKARVGRNPPGWL